MRKLGLIVVVIATVVLSSCSREGYLPEQDGSRLPGELAPLTISTGEMTRTSLSGTVVNWSDDDMIAVFDDLHYNNKFDAVEVSRSVAVFAGLVTAKTTDFYAVYPHSDAVEADNEAIYVSLPADQTPVSGTFAEEHNISVAHGTKAAEADVVDGIVFKNVCSLIKFTLPDKLSKISEVSFMASNRMLAGDLTISKSDYGVDVKSGSNTVEMKGSFGAGSTFYFVVAPGDISGFSITVTAENGANYTKSSAKKFSAEAGKIKDLGIIDFPVEPRVWAEHDYPSGKLTGTTVMLDLGLPPGMEEYVEKVEAYVQKPGYGNVYRSISLDAAEGEVCPSVEITASYGNTYLQPNEYVAHITYYMNEKTITRDVVFTVPDPEFTVTASAYTSYTKYSNGYISDANACAPGTIYDIRCSVNISDDLLSSFGLDGCVVALKKSGVENILNKNAAGETINKVYRSNFFELASLSGQSMGEYQLTAKVTFDGVTKSCTPVTLHITGLPYKMSEHPRDSRWQFDAGGGTAAFDEDTRIVLKSSKKNSASLGFHIPMTTNVKVYTEQVSLYTPTRLNRPTLTLFIANESVKTMQAESGTAKYTYFSNVEASGRLTSSNSMIKFERTFDGVLNADATISNVSVYYR